MKNEICFRLWGKYALFTDPITKIGGEKCSYHIPTYEAIKGIVRSIYWKPTLIWVVDRVRVMKQVKTQTKGMKPLKYTIDKDSNNRNTLSMYNYLSDVEYHVQAHFEWNMYRPELEQDRSEGKHYEIAKRMLERGGRRDIFLGTRECQGYVEPCEFEREESYYDSTDEIAFGLMFHSFSYPEESGARELLSRFWQAKMRNGVIAFPRPDECGITKYIHAMSPVKFIPGENFSGVQEEEV